MDVQRFKRGSRLLIGLGLLFLSLALLPQTAYVQGPAPAGETNPPPVTADTAVTTSAATAGPDCSKPPTGHKVKLLGDDEIKLIFGQAAGGAKDTAILQPGRVDNNGKTITNLSVAAWPDLINQPYWKDINWPTITMADLDGTGKHVPIAACRDGDKRIAATNPLQFSPVWNASGGPFEGKDIAWVDIAAGNLNGHYTGDQTDEVVIAFKDNVQNLHLLTLDKATLNRPNYASGWYWGDTSNGRGQVRYVTVATGDLNGDGYDNEIVTAFVDGNMDLQCMVFRQDADNAPLQLLWWRAWTNYDRDIDWSNRYDGGGYTPWYSIRPIDVATGDLDGDFQDEIILAFRDGGGGSGVAGQVQLLVLNYLGLDLHGKPAFDDRVFTQYDPGTDITEDHVNVLWPPSVSVVAADLDGNGRDEIAVAYSVKVERGHFDWTRAYHGYHRLQTYEFAPPDLEHNLQPWLKETGHWISGQISFWSDNADTDSRLRLAVDAGDLDRDGKAEIALVRLDDQTGVMRLSVFQQGPAGLTQSSSLQFPGLYGDTPEFWLAMGDEDGDSVYGNYTGGCYESEQVHVTALVHAPPHWSAYNAEDTLGGFGVSVSHGGGSGESTETKMGGSVKFGPEWMDITIVPAITYEWERSCTVEDTVVTTTLEGYKFETAPASEIWDGVAYDVVPYWCYTYTTDLGNSPAVVCVPRPVEESRTTAKSLDWWYITGTVQFPDSWVPVGVNLARNMAATQSSTPSGSLPPGPARLAVDGNTNGDYAKGSVTLTGNDPQAWWQVNLGATSVIHAVQVWNRTDCCADRLTDFYVLVSEAPFASTNLAATINQPGVWHYHHVSQAGRPTTIIWPDFERANPPPGEDERVAGRYVRIQLAGQNALNLAEVQVWGVPTEVDTWPRTMPIAGADTFTVTLPSGGHRVVDGALVWSWRGTQRSVEPGSLPGEFDIGGGVEEEHMQEDGTSRGLSIGFEAHGIGYEIKMGVDRKKSRIMTWSKETEFSGTAQGLSAGTSPTLQYTYEPYVWLQRAMSSGGVEQAFLVLDYSVLHRGLNATDATAPIQPLSASVLAPQVPLVGCPTHPDPATWYVTSTATFTWTQPAGDPATVAGYRWYLDQTPDTIPADRNMGLTTTHTYRNLRDGLWYLHVRAVDDGGAWSDTAHRAIRLDVNPPRVTLAVDPPLPTGNNGWYVTPVTVTVVATDATGSGVAAVEVSTDTITWQPYVAPLPFTSDTATTTVWARATDAVGHTSDPVSTTFRIDLTPPDSTTPASPMPGAWIAAAVTDTLGNEHLVLAGAITDTLSGQAGMDILALGEDGTSASAIGEWHPFAGQPEVEVNWYYTATTELGRGNHIFSGRASDQAGNLEDTHELAQVVWYPQSTPDLGGSSLIATPPTVRPGDEVAFVITVRNGGYQEAHVAVTNTLPAGLTPVTDTLASDAGYNPATGVITWPARLLWPGEWTRISFRTRVNAALGATVVENQALLHACWPNTESLPAAQRQRFQDREQTVVVTATVTVDPGLATSTDVTPPWASLDIHSGQAVQQRDVGLDIVAGPDARWMFLREWTLDPATGVWTVAQDSGWLHYTSTYTWTLSAGDGVKYLGVWVADNARNVSALDERGLAFTNLIGASHSLADGGRAQYRFNLERGMFAGVYVTALSGDPDLYIWTPLNAFWPNYYSNGIGGPGTVDEAGDWVGQTGLHLVEVKAVGNSQYQLTPFLGSGLMPGETGGLPRTKTSPDKDRPAHPLAVSDPLSAGQVGILPGRPPVEIYLPIVSRGG